MAMPYLNRYIGMAILLIGAAFCSSNATSAQELSVIPAPLSATWLPGTVEIQDGAVVSYSAGDTAAKFAAQHFVDLVQRTRGMRLIAKPALSGSHFTPLIAITRTVSVAGMRRMEAYDLHVSPQQITISADDDAGLLYGTVTLWEMLTATDVQREPAYLRCVYIHDEPQLRWRGIMLDSARHMQSVQFIKQLIDWMSLEKLNVLHWHLTDDQGWRLEIKRYPKLTAVGGWRELPYTYATRNEVPRKSHRYGGYYSQDEVRNVVAYAAQRNVMIVPEIEMPGHASAALAAYPEFGSSATSLNGPANGHGVMLNLYNTNDATFNFIENILVEVMQLFPSAYIHIGGDETIKDQWKASPAIQRQMKQLGISNEEEMQRYFVNRIDAFLAAHNRRTVGWDEILQSGLAQGAAVMSWHGVQGAIDAAKQGHDTVLTPKQPLYFNYRQSDAADEAPGRFVLNTLADVYAFNPTPDALTAAENKHVLGIQASLWSEYFITEDRAAWMLFPRSAALAETAWAPPERRNWNGFLPRMVAEMRRYRALDINFDPAAFRVRSAETLEPDHARVTVSLSNQTHFGTLRYTTDGSTVTATSAQYESPLSVPLSTHLRAAAFLSVDAPLEEAIPGSELDRQLDLASVRRRYSQELTLCENNPAIAMEQDPIRPGRPVMLANYRNPCWIYHAADLKGVTEISAGVVSLPYLFSEPDRASPFLGESHTANGEIEVHLDTCDGKLMATLPLEPAIARVDVTPLHAIVPELQGTHDLCLKVVRPDLNPLWVLDWVQLGEASAIKSGQPLPH
jgi:hexosaminidase